MRDLRWPHDPGVDWGSRITGSAAEEMGHMCTQARWLAFRISVTRGSARTRLIKRLTELQFVLYNGTAVPYVEGKLHFGQIVTDLGYHAPRTVTYIPNQPITDLLVATEAIDTDSPKRFCKPLDGCRGLGIFVAPTPQAAVDFVSRQACVYLVQQVIAPVKGDCRYILHRTSADLEAGSAPSVRVTYERIGPTVVGDGQSTITKLIGKLRRSDADKVKLALGVANDRIPERGERIELIASGHISRPVTNRPVCGDRLQALDAFMLKFLADLENYLRGPIATLCVDIGLNGPVFYEWQQQFALLSYMHDDKWQPAATWRLYQSMLRSGCIARTLNQ